MWAFKYFNNRYNNYLIFKYVYYHTVAHKNLYNFYPLEYGDSNHYGPVFSVVIAPFALLPDAAGLLLWNLMNAGLLLWAISLLPITNRQKTFVALLSSLEFAAAEHYIQFNAVITAFIIFSFILVNKQKDQWATLFIALGTLIKLYPIIGLAFFMFSKQKKRFIISGLCWMALFFVLPMLISSPQFVVQSYADWYASLHEKVGLNIDFSSSQDISVMGTFRRLTNNVNLPNLPFVIAGAVLFAVPMFRFSQHQSVTFRLYVLATALLTVVLFSSGSEHPTYIIAAVGAMLWLMLQTKPFSGYNLIVLILFLLITGLGPTDAFPKTIRHEYINKYVMKAWPCILIWATICWQLWFKKFNIVVNKHQAELPVLHSLAS
ncbi:glycosyltransferase family 87 protein [Mucilaginibacter koreensis]